MRIGLFDSGIGGLTVLKSLIDRYPNNDYIYLGDTKNVPYGSKTKEELFLLAKNNVNFLLSKNVDAIIIACGTVSANCYQELKKIYRIPIYDIISPTISYINNSDYKNIGLIATEATVNSHIFKNKINKNVFEIATPKLVPLIENNELDNIEIVLNDYLKNYLNKIDVLILGCTHYPKIINDIKRIINNKTMIINMAENIKLKENNGHSIKEIYYTKLNDKIIANTNNILNTKCQIKEVIIDTNN